jgi:hypothetical protein
MAVRTPLPAEYAPLGKSMQIVGGLLGLSIIIIAFLIASLMEYKPGQ